MRKPVGILLILCGMVFYIAGAAALGRYVAAWPPPLQILYFLIAGLVWVIPLRPLLRWMQQDV